MNMRFLAAPSAMAAASAMLADKMSFVDGIMTASFRSALMVLMYVALASTARAQTAEPSWKPDVTTIKLIEAALTLPSNAPLEPKPLDSYARYYKGMMLNGSRVIYGDLLRGQLAKEKPGIYLGAPPSIIMGGGCDQIQLWYDVDAHHILQIHCYGLG